ncbi:MAG: Stp1/IreP family PP2C-type Ser/Thr phosphatase [Calditrichia bacterium]
MLRIFARTDIGRIRHGNEDAYLVADTTSENEFMLPAVQEFPLRDTGIVLMVSDGMGGAAAGEVASRLATNTLQNELKFTTPPDETSCIRALVDSLQTANKVIAQHAREHPEMRGMGATATVMIILERRLYIGQVGDSRAYIVRGNTILQLTKDQSFVNQLLEAGKITEEEAENHPRRNVILQALGNESELNVAISTLEIRKNDKILICSDGLSGFLKKEAMLDIMLEAGDLQQATHDLVDLANEYGGQDNITAVLAEIVSVKEYEQKDDKVLIAAPSSDFLGKPQPVAATHDMDTVEFDSTARMMAEKARLQAEIAKLAAARSSLREEAKRIARQAAEVEAGKLALARDTLQGEAHRLAARAADIQQQAQDAKIQAETASRKEEEAEKALEDAEQVRAEALLIREDALQYAAEEENRQLEEKEQEVLQARAEVEKLRTEAENAIREARRITKVERDMRSAEEESAKRLAEKEAEVEQARREAEEARREVELARREFERVSQEQEAARMSRAKENLTLMAKDEEIERVRKEAEQARLDAQLAREEALRFAEVEEETRLARQHEIERLEQRGRELAKAKAEAEEARKEAERARLELEEARNQAKSAATAQESAEEAKQEAEQAKKEAEIARLQTAKAKSEAEEARAEAEEARKKALEAVKIEEEAEQAKLDAEKTVEEAEQAKLDAEKTIEEANRAKEEYMQASEQAVEAAKKEAEAAIKAAEAEAARKSAEAEANAKMAVNARAEAEALKMEAEAIAAAKEVEAEAARQEAQRAKSEAEMVRSQLEHQATLKEDEAKAALREALDAKAEAEATKEQIQHRAAEKEIEAEAARQEALKAKTEAEEAKQTLETLMVEIEDDVGQARKEALEAQAEAERAKKHALDEAEKAKQAKTEAEREVERVRDRLTRLIETDWMINKPAAERAQSYATPAESSDDTRPRRQQAKQEASPPLEMEMEGSSPDDEVDDVSNNAAEDANPQKTDDMVTEDELFQPESKNHEEETIVSEIAPAVDPSAKSEEKPTKFEETDFDFSEDMTGGFSSSIPLDDLLESQRLARAIQERDAEKPPAEDEPEDSMQTKELPKAKKEDETLYPIYQEEVARKNRAQQERERRFRNFQDRARTIAHDPAPGSKDTRKSIVRYLNGIPIVSNVAAKFVGLISDDKKSGERILLETKLQDLRSQLLNFIHSNERSLEAHPKGQSLLDEGDELADTLDIVQMNIEKNDFEPAAQLIEHVSTAYKGWKKNAEAVLKYNSGKQGF